MSLKPHNYQMIPTCKGFVWGFQQPEPGTMHIMNIDFKRQLAMHTKGPVLFIYNVFFSYLPWKTKPLGKAGEGYGTG